MHHFIEAAYGRLTPGRRQLVDQLIMEFAAAGPPPGDEYAALCELARRCEHLSDLGTAGAVRFGRELVDRVSPAEAERVTAAWQESVDDVEDLNYATVSRSRRSPSGRAVVELAEELGLDTGNPLELDGGPLEDEVGLPGNFVAAMLDGMRERYAEL